MLKFIIFLFTYVENLTDKYMEDQQKAIQKTEKSLEDQKADLRKAELLSRKLSMGD